MRTPSFLKRVTTYGALAALTVMVLAPGAVADDGSVSNLSQRQSVNAQLSPSGQVEQARIYTQLLAEGDGPLNISVPTSTRGLRNLEGFTKPAITGDSAEWQLDLREGEPLSRRTVADYTAELPITVEANYALDGEPIEARDVVGRSGVLTTTYTVTNVTGVPTEIEYRDGQGRRTQEKVDVTIPFAGTFTTTLDERFSGLDAPTAITAGDGRGNTVLSWSLLLFEPVGANTMELTWSARVKDAVIPPATAQVVPVVADGNPLENAAASFGDAADQTRRLTDGAVEIDRNVVRIATGAKQLLDGLTKLSDGSDALAEGLGSAASGSGELAAGTGAASDGSKKLASGLGDLRDGAGQLSAGLGSARDGGGKLAGGLGELSAGAGQLSDGLGSASDGGSALASGLGELSAGAGLLSGGAGQLAAGTITLDEKTGELVAGTGQLEAGAAALLAGLETLKASFNADTGTKKLIAGTDQLNAGVKKSIAGIGAPATPDTLLNGLARIEGGLNNPACDLEDPSNPLNPCGVLQVLALMDAGIGDASTPGTLLNGISRVQLGLSNTACDLANPKNAANPCGIKQGAELVKIGMGQQRAKLAAIDASGLSGADQTALGEVLYALGPKAEGGPDTLITGANGIQDGADLIIDGLGTAGTPDTVRNGIAQLEGAIAGLEAGIGSPAAAGTLRNGVARVSGGLDNPAAFAPGAGANPTCSDAGGLQPCGIKQGLQLVSGGLDNPPSSTSNPLCLAPGDKGYKATMDACGLKQGLELSLKKVNDGLGSVTDDPTKNPTLLGAANAVAGGSSALADGATRLRKEGTTPLAAGAGDLAEGAGKLSAGAKAAAEGSFALDAGLRQLDDGGKKLAAGAGTAATGAGALDAGLRQLDDGGKKLAAGAGTAATGAGDLSEGLGKIDDGANKLADGLGAAADGSGALSDGLKMAKIGGTNLATGSKRLHEEGTEVMATSVNDATSEQGRRVAMLKAAGERAELDGLPFPAPVGADATGVYKLELASASESGGAQATRVAVAFVILAAMAAGAAVNRRTAAVIAG